MKLQGLLKETITLLCKNGLYFNKGFIIDALIGITTDDNETFLLKLEESVGDVGGDDKVVDAKSDPSDDDRDRRSRASRKRRTTRNTDSTPPKRQRAGSDDDDSADDFCDDYDVDITNIMNEQDNDNLRPVKQEQSDYDGQYAPNTDTYAASLDRESQFTQDLDHSQLYDATTNNDDQYAQQEQSQTSLTAPDGSVDDGSHDGSSSTWNQSSTNDDTNAAAAAGSQQVR